jgi:hypothetical protein
LTVGTERYPGPKGVVDVDNAEAGVFALCLVQPFQGAPEVIGKIFFAKPHSYVRIVSGKLRPDIGQIRQIDLANAIGKPTCAEVTFNLEEPLDPLPILGTHIRALSFVPSAEEEIWYPIGGLNFAQGGGVFVDPDESSRRKMYNGSRSSFGNSYPDAVRQYPGNHGTADPC